MAEYIEKKAVLAEIENDYKNVEKIKTPFAKIIVDGSAEKPYYSILWLDKENKGYNVGYSSYCLDYVFKWLEVAFEFVAADEPPAADVVEVVWEPVLGFEGLYEVSSLGRVRNKKGEILKQRIKRTNCTCYKSVDLWKDGRYHKKYIHRLVAEAFLPNPGSLPMVNHKDEDGTNNFIDNLEWCTREYNVNYGTAKERRAKKIRGVPHTEEHKRKISESMKRYHGARMDGE